MSLLLDALRRAEEDSRKRKQGPGEAAAEAASSDVPPELSLQPPLSISGAPDDSAAVPLPELTLAEPLSAPAASPVLALELPVGGVGAVLLPPVSRAPVQPYGRYQRPASPLKERETGDVGQGAAAGEAAGDQSATPADRSSSSGQPFAADSAAAAAPVRAAAKTSAQAARGPNAAVVGTRQALSAASVMAGGVGRKAQPGKPQRRQWVLAAVAVVLALPIAAFVFFGDRLLGGTDLVVAQRILPAPAMPAPTPVAGLPAVAGGDVPAQAVAAAPGLPAIPVAEGPKAPEMPAAAVAPSTPVERAIPQAAARAAPSGVREPMAARPGPAQRTSSGSSSPVPRAAPATSPAGPALVPSAARPGSQMDSAYAAYQAGKPVEATRLYQEVLRADPTQRDAWLGLAVIAHGNGQRESAASAYRQVLRLEPQNATALAGLSSLASGAGEPLQESRLREMLARSPQEPDLNHALGMVLSGEQRWSEAQPLFFKAHALAPQEPQFAYDLAVALDHLRKSVLAAQYYATALALAEGKAPSFDPSSARSRLAALKARDPAGTPR